MFRAHRPILRRVHTAVHTTIGSVSVLLWPCALYDNIQSTRPEQYRHWTNGCVNSCVNSPEDGPVGPIHVEIRQYINKIEIVTSVGFFTYVEQMHGTKGLKYIYIYIFLLCRCDSTRVMASSFLRFLEHTQRRTAVGRTPLDEWSAHRRDLYLTTHDTHNRQTSMSPVGFEPTISAGERPQTYALDGAATGTGKISTIIVTKFEGAIFYWKIFLRSG